MQYALSYFYTNKSIGCVFISRPNFTVSPIPLRPIGFYAAAPDKLRQEISHSWAWLFPLSTS